MAYKGPAKAKLVEAVKEIGKVMGYDPPIETDQINQKLFEEIELSLEDIKAGDQKDFSESAWETILIIARRQEKVPSWAVVAPEPDDVDEDVETEPETEPETETETEPEPETKPPTKKSPKTKETPKKQGVGAFVYENLDAGAFDDMSNKDIAILVREHFDSQTTPACISWYKNKHKNNAH